MDGGGERGGGRVQTGRASEVALPAPIAAEARNPWVNRTAELAALEGAWSAAASGDRALALISGEPGIGKSGLAARIAARAQLAGAAVLYGRCDEDLDLAYQPFVEAIEAYARAAPGSALAGQTSHGAALLARLVPSLDPGTAAPRSTEDAEMERLLLFDAVARLFALAASEAPLVLVLEDLHWATQPTLLLLRHLVRSAEPRSLLIVATYRDTEGSRSRPVTAMLQDLRTTPGFRRIALSGLDPPAVAELVSQLAPDLDADAAAGDPEVLAKALHARTDGNPLWVIELLLHPELADLGPSRELRPGVALPDSVREAVGRRIARLDANTTRVLSAASIIGREFSLDVLERMPDLLDQPDQVLDAIEEALTAKIVEEHGARPGTYAFTHSLLREAIYADLSLARRARLHQRIADALERLPDRPGRLEALAHHALEGAVAGETTERAVRSALLAGARAAAMLAYESALSLYTRALSAVDNDPSPDPLLRCDVLLAMAEAQLWAGQREASQASVDAAAALARAAADPTRLARAALNRGPLSVYIVLTDAGQSALLEEALEALGDRDPKLRAVMLARLSLNLAYSEQRDRATDLSRQALALARTLGDPLALCYALSARLDTFGLVEEPEERLALAFELAQLGERLRDDEITMHGHLSVIRECLQTGDGIGIRRAIERCESLANTGRHPVSRSSALMGQGLLALFEGRLAEGERLANEAFALREPYHELAMSLYGALMIWTWWQQARLPEIAPVMLEMISDAPVEFGAAEQAALALVHVEMGNYDEARATLHALAAERYASVSVDQSWGLCAAALASVCAALREANLAADLYGLLLPLRDTVIAAGAPPCCFGPADHYLGLLAATLGDDRQAVVHFERSIELSNRLGAPTLRAASEAELGAVLLESSEPEERARATAMLEAARHTAVACGLHRIATRVATFGEPSPPAEA